MKRSFPRYALFAATLFVGVTAIGRSQPTELFFSEYIEGSSNNKALEIFNGTGATVDLAAGGYNAQMDRSRGSGLHLPHRFAMMARALSPIGRLPCQ